jgi:hypothetical protein
MSDDGVLDEAYERLHRTGPEFEGWLTNHGPMAVESLVRHGHGETVHRWLDGYTRRLEELPRGTSPIDPAEWREALGAAHRLGDWLAFFDREERPWREVLMTWWPRLLPGIAAGATHGVIRTGHAVHTLLNGEADGPRLTELGQALGYWATRWQPVPAAAPSGTAIPGDALGRVPRVPDQNQGIRYRLGQLTDLPEWTRALSAAAGRVRRGGAAAAGRAGGRRDVALSHARSRLGDHAGARRDRADRRTAHSAGSARHAVDGEPGCGVGGERGGHRRVHSGRAGAVDRAARRTGVRRGGVRPRRTAR